MIKKQLKQYLAERSAQSSPSDATSMVALDKGEVVNVPFNSLPSGGSSGGCPYGLSNYFLPGIHTSMYMSAIKEKIETEGGDITKLNYINANGSYLLIKFAYVGGNYYVYCVDLLKLKSYYYSIDISTTTIADFLAMDSVAVGDESSSGGSSSYTYNVVSTSTMSDLINDMESKGYTENDTVLLHLKGTSAAGNYVGAINTWADGSLFSFSLIDVNTATLYYAKSAYTDTTIVSAFETATKTELAGGGDVYGLSYYSVTGNSKTTYMSAIKEAIEANGGDLTKLNYVILNSYQFLIRFLNAGSLDAVWCLDLFNLKAYYYTLNLSTITIADFLAKDSVAVGGDSSSGSFPDISVEWDSPTTKLSVLLDAVREAGLTIAGRHLFVQLAGYSGALLFADFNMSGDTSSYVCSIKAKDFYSDKWFEVKNVDATTITIQDFLNTTGDYVVLEEDTSSDGSSVVKMQITGGASLSLGDIRDAIIAAGKDDTVPTLVSLSGIYGNKLLIWFQMSGNSTGFVTCWELDKRKVYTNISPLTLASVQLKDFLTADYEATLGSRFPSMTPITYDKLKALRDSGTLEPGMFYRITDYRCTTTQENTGAMNNQFDIIVQAINENTLSETASADRHEGDTYFENTNFGAWELKYCLDNDSSRFAWALDKKYSLTMKTSFKHFNAGDVLERCEGMDWNDPVEGYSYAWTTREYMDSWETEKCLYTDTAEITDETKIACYTNQDYWTHGSMLTGICDIACVEGKGVVYYMKDEFGNECPYDFKNITYKGESIAYNPDTEQWYGEELGIDADTYYPTFANLSLLSYSQWGDTYGVTRDTSLDTTIDGVTYYGYACSSSPSAWGGNIFYMTDSEITSSSTMYKINDGMPSVINFGGELQIRTSLDNSLGGTVRDNVVNRWRSDLDGSDKCRLNSNIFIGGAFSNVLGVNCHNNTFGNMFRWNNLGRDCYDNVFGAGCSSNNIGNNCGANKFSDYFLDNTIGDDFISNEIAGSTSACIFGRSTHDMTLKGGLYACKFEGLNSNITIGEGWYNNLVISYGLANHTLAPVEEVEYPQVFKPKGTVETEV